ncbi:hypothetical protein DFH07DRAFT_964653 [Mycena maculata]|uniref:Uncharacterized protein n=1 Tax=Mycena maculata TaxID=230809 RepID=A0AAD7IHQ0_9AGAR|nr:hypothetical protein DFH07DRAFT_964653 [Mycena maculata]
MSYAERWVVADIHIMFPLFHQLTTICGRLSALTSLEIIFHLDDGVEVDARLWDTFAVAPKLTAVRGMFWNSLRRCASIHISVEPTHTIIFHVPLEYEEVDTFPENIVPARLPHLRSLLLMIAEDFGPIHSSSSSLLHCLETPCLTRLSTYWTADEEAVLSLLTRSDCTESVKFLHLHSTSILPDNVLALLQRMPRLTDLEIGDFDGSLVPQSSLAVFLDAFSSRWLAAQKSHGLQRLRVRIVDGLLDPTPDLSVMQKDGLFIEIFQHTYFPDLMTD